MKDTATPAYQRSMSPFVRYPRGGDMLFETGQSVVQYPGTKARDPVHYEHSTVYTSTIKMRWRLKLFGADKHEEYVSFRTNPKKSWDRLVKRMKSVNK